MPKWGDFMKKIIRDFFKDMMSTTAVYFISTFLVVLFFYLYTDGNVPIVYPVFLSGFVYLIFIGFQLYKYLKFNIDVKKTVHNPNYDICTDTCQQKNVSSVIGLINNKYINEIGEMNKEFSNRNKFFSQWVHNMKTPVSVIDLIIQKLISEEEYDEKLVSEIKEENNRILNNLEQVLNMIRIDNFSRDYVPEVIDLEESIKKVINDRKSQFIYNNVFPKIEDEYASLRVLSDAKWNEFMLGQIVSNAIKYSKIDNEACDKSLSKKVYFKFEKEGKYMILTIKDEGIGIPDYDIQRVFEPFFTGENGRKQKNSTGIGLYICSVIAQKLGHEIKIKSTEGVGTEFRIKYLSKS